MNTERISKIAIVLLVFGLALLVMHTVPLGEAPDEEMRFLMADYMYRHGQLPRGGDPEIRNPAWGLSYAYQPVNAYLYMAIAMRAAHALGVSDSRLYLAARFVNVLFAAGTCLICFRIGGKLFSGVFKLLFVLLVTLLPQFLFVSGYVNCDAYGVFCVALILLAVIHCRENAWNRRSCIGLGAAVGLGVLSYYNVYGVILVTVLYCIAAVLTDPSPAHRGSLVLRRFLLVFAVAFALSGWWFIRSAVLYGGDILGEAAARAEAEQYAADPFKPSLIETPRSMGYSLRDMLSRTGWMGASCQSYVAVFSNMSLFMGSAVYVFARNLVGSFTVIWCADGILLPAKKIRLKRQDVLFTAALALMCFATLALSAAYSYGYDFQPQGRYLFPMLIPGSILCVKGLVLLGNFLPEKLLKLFAVLVMLGMTAVVIYSIPGVLYHAYTPGISAVSQEMSAGNVPIN